MSLDDGRHVHEQHLNVKAAGAWIYLPLTVRGSTETVWDRLAAVACLAHLSRRLPGHLHEGLRMIANSTRSRFRSAPSANAGRSTWLTSAAGVMAPLSPAIEPLRDDMPLVRRGATLPDNDIMAIMADPQDQLATIANAMAISAAATHLRGSR